MEELANIVSYVSMYSVVLPALIGLYFFRRLRHVQRSVFALVLLSVSAEVVSQWAVHTSEYQHLVFHAFTVLEFSLLIYIFSRTLPPFFPRALFGVLFVGFLLFALADLFWFSSIQQFKSYSTVLESVIIIFLSISYLYKVLSELKIKYLARETMIWLSTGLLLYFASSLFIFLFTNYIDTSNATLFIIWGIHAIFSILLNVFYTIALWIKPTT